MKNNYSSITTYSPSIGVISTSCFTTSKSSNPFDDQDEDDKESMFLLPSYQQQQRRLPQQQSTEWKPPYLVRVSSWMPIVISSQIDSYVYIIHVTPNQIENNSYIIEKRFSVIRKLFLELSVHIESDFPAGGMRNKFPDVSFLSLEWCPFPCPCLPCLPCFPYLRQSEDERLNNRLDRINSWMRELCLHQQFMNNSEAFAIFSSFLQSDKVTR